MQPACPALPFVLLLGHMLLVAEHEADSGPRQMWNQLQGGSSSPLIRARWSARLSTSPLCCKECYRGSSAAWACWGAWAAGASSIDAQPLDSGVAWCPCILCMQSCLSRRV